MPQPFWDPGSTPGGSYLNPGTGQWENPTPSIDCLLPDLSIQNVLPDRWAWDVIYIAFQRVPGLAEVDFSRKHHVDRRKASGADGEQVTSLGYKAADVTIKIRMWTPQQFTDFQNITIPIIQPRPGKQARPVSVLVDYPSLSMWGISSIFITNIAGPIRTSTIGVWEVKIKATEVRPPVSVGTATQRGGGAASIPNAVTGQTPTTAAAPPSATINTPTTGQ